MELELILGIWDYHWWGNRTLFPEAVALDEETARKDLRMHWSFPTLKGMLAHIYGADRVWLGRWKGASPTKLYGDADFASLRRSPHALGRAGGRAAGVRDVAGQGGAHAHPRRQGHERQALRP